MPKRPIPPKPEGYTLLSFFRRCVWEALWAGDFPFASTNTVRVNWDGANYSFDSTAANVAPLGRFMGEYDPDQSYRTGDWFTVAPGRTLVLGAVTVDPGIYAINPAGEDFDGNEWTGTMPANPSLVANTVEPLPALGEAAAGPYCAKLVMAYC